jgi:molecular chaperone GrpE
VREKKTERPARQPAEEPSGEGAGSEGAPAPPEESKAAPSVEALRLEAADFRDKWHRAVADLENYKKRAARDRERDLWNARAGVTLALLDVLDDLERALADEKADPDAFRRGIGLIREKFLAALDRIGVTPFVSVGETFDPEKHDALQRIPSPDVEDGCVAAEIRRGYRSGDRVLRHALVAVAGAAPPNDESDR